MVRVDAFRELVAATKLHDDARAAWAGAELLLDFFGNEPALWRVGFEVPS